MKWRIVVRFTDPEREPSVGSWFVSRDVVQFQEALVRLTWGDKIESVEIEEGV